jgi:hypothetical protein
MNFYIIFIYYFFRLMLEPNNICLFCLNYIKINTWPKYTVNFLIIIYKIQVNKYIYIIFYL